MPTFTTIIPLVLFSAIDAVDFFVDTGYRLLRFVFSLLSVLNPLCMLLGVGAVRRRWTRAFRNPKSSNVSRTIPVQTQTRH